MCDSESIAARPRPVAGSARASPQASGCAAQVGRGRPMPLSMAVVAKVLGKGGTMEIVSELVKHSYSSCSKPGEPLPAHQSPGLLFKVWKRSPYGARARPEPEVPSLSCASARAWPFPTRR